jgi:hypothetical protein
VGNVAFDVLGLRVLDRVLFEGGFVKLLSNGTFLFDCARRDFGESGTFQGESQATP